MQAEVIKKFINKYSKSLHKKGDLLDISENRFEEINSAGHGKLVKKIEVDTEKE